MCNCNVKLLLWSMALFRRFCGLHNDLHNSLEYNVVTSSPHWKSAAEQHSRNAAQRRAQQIFTLSYRGGGASEIIGYAALAAQLGIKESSIPVLLSRGKGSFTLMRTNPLTGEEDLLEVTRLLPAKPPKRPRGRPKTAHAADPRLGIEFAGFSEESDFANGKKLAKTVPKSRNRRTREKS